MKVRLPNYVASILQIEVVHRNIAHIFQNIYFIFC